MDPVLWGVGGRQYSEAGWIPSGGRSVRRGGVTGIISIGVRGRKQWRENRMKTEWGQRIEPRWGHRMDTEWGKGRVQGW